MVGYNTPACLNSKTGQVTDGSGFPVYLALEHGSGFQVISPLVASSLDPDQEGTFIVEAG